MPTIPTSMAPLIDQYMRETGQIRDNTSSGNDLKVVCHDDILVSVKRPKKFEMAPFVYLEPATWVIPVRLESEMNRRGSVKGQSARNRTVKNAVYRALGPYWKEWGPFGDRVRNGEPCVIRAIRLGGAGLDMGGLWASMKFPEDAIANLLGVDDGWPAWKRSFQVDQEPGQLWGLRIEMRLPPLTPTDGKEQ